MGTEIKNIPQQPYAGEEILSLLFVYVKDLYVILFFTRQNRTMVSTGYLFDWNKTGYSQNYDGKSKYGLKSFTVQYHVLHTFITYCTHSSRTAHIHHVLHTFITYCTHSSRAPSMTGK